MSILKGGTNNTPPLVKSHRLNSTSFKFKKNGVYILIIIYK